MQRRIYIASSWRGEKDVLNLATLLRRRNHEVYAFCEDGAGHYSFGFSTTPGAGSMTAREMLQTDEARQAFAADKAGLDWADTCVLLLPAGRSSHLEAGYAVGQGKDLFILDLEAALGECDVMYGFARAIRRTWPELATLLEASP